MCIPQVYREDLLGARVTYARGCQSEERNVANDKCDEFSSESCSTVGLHTVSIRTLLYVCQKSSVSMYVGIKTICIL